MSVGTIFAGGAFARIGRIGQYILAGALALCTATPAAAQTCDRTCMTGLLTRYVDAVVAHDPAGLPLAEGARITEDSRVIVPGEGIWQSVTGKGEFRHDYLDPRTQIAATHVALLEGANHLL